METGGATDKTIGFPLAFGALALLAAVGLAAFGMTGDQIAAGWAFALSLLAGTLAIATVHVYA